MFGNMFNKKLMEKMASQMQEIKSKLEKIHLTGQAENVKVVANGNRMIHSIEIDATLFEASNKTELEGLIITAANRALEQAEKVEKSEMSHAAMGILPGMS